MSDTALTNEGVESDRTDAHQVEYWMQQEANCGGARYPLLFALYQIVKVLWRIRDLLNAIYMAQPEADDIEKAVVRALDSRSATNQGPDA
jgi:hypothetical protein